MSTNNFWGHRSPSAAAPSSTTSSSHSSTHPLIVNNPESQEDEDLHPPPPSSSSRSLLFVLLGGTALVGAAGASLFAWSSQSAPTPAVGPPEQKDTRKEQRMGPPLHPPQGQVGSRIYSFGSNSHGCLGQGDDTLSSAQPVAISSLNAQAPFMQVVAGGRHCAALGTDGVIHTWGASRAGVLGHSTGPLHVPVSIPTVVDKLRGKKIVHLSVSSTHAAAVELIHPGDATTGPKTRVWTWGTKGALGLGEEGSNTSAGSGPVADDRFVRGGSKRSQQLSEKDVDIVPFPQPVTALDDAQVVAVSCGNGHTLARTAWGSVYSFGRDSEGALAQGDREPRPWPTIITQLQEKRIVDIAAGDGLSLFLSDSGEVLASGSNNFGQAGVGSSVRRILHPTPVVGLKEMDDIPIRKVATGELHAGVIDAQGHLSLFGWNQSGQCGVGSRTLEVRMPQRVASGVLDPTLKREVESVSLGFGHTAAIDKQHRLIMFGRGREGQLGRADQLESIAAYRDSPVDVTYFTSHKLEVVQAAAGQDFTLALVK